MTVFCVSRRRPYVICNYTNGRSETSWFSFSIVKPRRCAAKTRATRVVHRLSTEHHENKVLNMSSVCPLLEDSTFTIPVSVKTQGYASPGPYSHRGERDAFITTTFLRNMITPKPAKCYASVLSNIILSRYRVPGVKNNKNVHITCCQLLWGMGLTGGSMST